uniref:Uncharacterized protein n=1 Tax=Tanacetum cinerariifolium TaxID=118510 RepID=A0A6L2MA28_TANCI|nr:hypothetical protein [Tanacetum cinerariifolium]
MSKGKSEKGLVAESFEWDNELVSFEDEKVNKVKEFMTIAEDEPSVGKADVRSGQWVEITMKKQVSSNIVCALGGRGKKKETISSTEVGFAKAAESPSKTALAITSDSKSECDNQEPLPPLPKFLGAEPSGTSKDAISLANLTLTLVVFEEIKKVLDKKLAIKVLKKKTQTVTSSVPDPLSVKVADSSTKQPRITLMKEVKGLKEQIKAPTDNSLTMIVIKKAKCFVCQSTDHLTKEHPEQVVIKRTLAKLKAQSSQGSSLRKALMIPKPFADCKNYSFNDHHSDEYEYYPRSDICGSIAHETTYCTKKPLSTKGNKDC